ncbi:sigma factor-like helix-turn-helix DNA-binding protein [Hoeflea sp. AS60]|uniref:RNA polymerase sigma factor n=1 Tax=Hoeflea sp. AS60 TaxID=3135780 RepID=UPI00318036D0
MQSSSTLGFQRSFDVIRNANLTIMRRFSDPVSVLEFLHRGTEAPERKNDVLGALVEAAQADHQTASCAQTLVLLALWPGLDAVRRRLIWRWKLAPEDVAAEVMGTACKAIAGMDLTRVGRIAATLLRNVERDIGRALLREADRHEQHSPIDPDQLPLNAASEDPRESEANLTREVEALIGRDARLVLSVAWEGLTQSEAGAALGLSEAAARKRFQRATHRLRDALH